MKIVILGAGASYDCINKYHEKEHELDEVLKWRPPLGNDILGSRKNFREIYDLYPGAQTFSHAINASSDIEDFFQKKWTQAIEKGDNVTLANLINTQYCFQHLFFVISQHYSKNIGSNNYQILLQQAHDYTIQTGEEVAFITFNYDLLLEYELLKIYAPYDDINLDTYTKYPIKIFKPHGSCNWVREFKDWVSYDIVSNLLIQKRPLSELEDKLEKLIKINYFNFESFRNPKTNNDLFLSQNIEFDSFRGYFPQLLIPMKDKDEFVMPKEHEAQMVECLKKMTDLLVIGWKGQEAKFLELLKGLDIQRDINLTGVTCGESQMSNELKRVLKGIKIENYITDYYRVKDPNYYPHDVIYDHKIGTFSSFILNTENKLTKGFFEY